MLRVQSERIIRGWSRASLAEKSGLTPVTIEQIENGRTNCASALREIARVFGWAETSSETLTYEIGPVGKTSRGPKYKTTEEEEAVKAVMTRRGRLRQLSQILCSIHERIERGTEHEQATCPPR